MGEQVAGGDLADAAGDQRGGNATGPRAIPKPLTHDRLTEIRLGVGHQMGAQSGEKIGLQQPHAALPPADAEILADENESHHIGADQQSDVLDKTPIVRMQMLTAIDRITDLGDVGRA